MQIFPLVMHEVITSSRDCTHHNARVEANQPVYTMHSLLMLDVFTHNLHASYIVYSCFNYRLIIMMISIPYQYHLIGINNFQYLQVSIHIDTIGSDHLNFYDRFKSKIDH